MYSTHGGLRGYGWSAEISWSKYEGQLCHVRWRLGFYLEDYLLCLNTREMNLMRNFLTLRGD